MASRLLSSFLRIVRIPSMRRILTCGAVLVCLVSLAAMFAVREFQESALSESEREHKNIAYLLSEYFAGQLNTLAEAQQELVKASRTAKTSPEGSSRSLSSESDKALDRSLSAHQHIALLAMFDATARVIGVRSRPPFGSDLSWVAGIVDEVCVNTSNGEVLRPLWHSVSGRWLLVLSRAIRDDANACLGATLGAVDLSVWQHLSVSLSLKQADRFALMHMDGTLVLRHPYADDKIGQRFAMPSVHSPLTDANPQRTFRAHSPIDRDLRIGAVRKVRNFPLVASANTTAHEAIADRSRQTQVISLIALGSIAIVATILIFVAREIVSEYASSERRVEHERTKLDLALNNMTQGLLLYDASHRLQICNQSYFKMFGLSPDVVKPGVTFREIVKHRQAMGSFTGDLEAYCSAIERDLAADRVQRRLVTAPNGKVVQMTNKQLPGGSWIMTMEDVTELRTSHERIAYMAMHDTLTNLLNRRGFLESLRVRLEAVTPGSPLALLLVDLDCFKIVNDTFGHGVGDELLTGVARCLLRRAGDNALIARLGGDEFAVALVGATAENASQFAGELLGDLDTPINAGPHELEAKASVGIAIASDAETDLDQFIRRADLALYAAKASGGDVCRVFTLEMEAASNLRNKLEYDLRFAIAEQKLEVHYQPIVDTHSGAIVGHEALARWPHPERGMIPPTEFIPLAEETHLIIKLGTFVLEMACRQAAIWPGNTYVAVNVSPIQFRAETFAFDTMSALSKSGLDPRRLVLEVTETVLLQRETVVLEAMRRLRAIGVKIALDDFGTGYSSLSYLQRFPFSKIKIDRSFISTLTATNGSKPIVAAIISLAKAVGMTTTAEGVEDVEQQKILIDLGCQEAQGYLFGRPSRANAETLALAS